MRSTRSCSLNVSLALLAALLVAQAVHATGSSFPCTVTDTGGKTVHLKDQPKRVVSLVPGATETFFALGAGDLIVGPTYYDINSSEAVTKRIVGGFLDPAPELVERLKPDLILLSSLHTKVRERFSDSGIPLIQVDTPTMEDGFRMIELVGDITNKKEEAAEKISQIRKQLDLVSRKVANPHGS